MAYSYGKLRYSLEKYETHNNVTLNTILSMYSMDKIKIMQKEHMTKQAEHKLLDILKNQRFYQ